MPTTLENRSLNTVSMDQFSVPEGAIDGADGISHLDSHTVANIEFAIMQGLIEVQEDGTQLYAGRLIIDRDDDDIEGKVDIRAVRGGGEAIVVDSKKYPAGFEKLTESWKDIFEKDGGSIEDEQAVLKAVLDSVTSVVDYDDDATAAMYGELTDKYKKVNLGDYLTEGKGSCRHMALSAVWLIGQLNDAGILKNRATAEVNQREIKDFESDRTQRDAHEWATYHLSEGGSIVIDPAQGYMGPKDGSKGWHYALSTDKTSFSDQDQQERDKTPKASEMIVEQVRTVLEKLKQPIPEEVIGRVAEQMGSIAGLSLLGLLEATDQGDVMWAEEIEIQANKLLSLYVEHGGQDLARDYKEEMIVTSKERRAWTKKVIAHISPHTELTDPATYVETTRQLIPLILEDIYLARDGNSPVKYRRED